MNLILHKNGRWINQSKNSRHMGGDVDLQLINCNLHVYIAVNAISFHIQIRKTSVVKNTDFQKTVVNFITFLTMLW